ncbi:MAG: archaeosortase/exosortase family protein [Coriobacteriia bacterium]|nr:archaeosortase/exosortase family protein [Coriobacteriia bacterium]
MTVGMGILVAGTAAWALVVAALRRARYWLLFYLLGGLGFVLVVLFWASRFGLDDVLEAFEAKLAVGIASVAGIALSQLGATGLAIPNHTGWAVFDVGIECSALIEMAAIVGLTVFYPAFDPARKAVNTVVGITTTFAINMLRIMVIVLIINAYGTGWVFAAHAVFGRVVFFIGTVALYWWLVTRPTVGVVRTALGEGSSG